MKIKILKRLLFLSPLFLLISCLTSPETQYQEIGKLRAVVRKYKLEKYAKAENDLAEKNYSESRTLIDGKKNFKADKTLKEANKYFKIIIEKGLPPYTEERNTLTKEQKKSAEDIKANVAVKEQFAEAEKTYNEALTFQGKKEYEKAIETYEKAESQFKQVYGTAREKRDKTEKSINSTEDIKKELEKNASELDVKLKEIEKKDSTGDGGAK